MFKCYGVTIDIEYLNYEIYDSPSETLRERKIPDTLMKMPDNRKIWVLFINTSGQGLELVKAVNSPGFGLHLDAAAMNLNQEPVELALQQAIDYLCHFHISEPYLAPVGNAAVNHQRLGSTLNPLNYPSWRSIEMRTGHTTDNSALITKALETAISCYQNE